MAEFTTRVELHDEKPGDYPKLHIEMEEKGFFRTIKADSGTVYKLPHAEYNYHSAGDVEPKAIYDKAHEAVKAIGRDAGIFVTKSDGRHMGGLKRA